MVKMEGLVIKNYNRKHPLYNHQMFAKLVTDDFKENNKAVFGSVKQKESDSTKILDQYATEARIRKAVLKFVNEDNHKLDLKLMSLVPHYIIKDIFKEEIIDIIKSYSFIDLREIRHLLPRRCLKVINDMMLEKVK